MMQNFDEEGLLKKTKYKEGCLLCGKNGNNLVANHDEHFFCNECWEGVT